MTHRNTHKSASFASLGSTPCIMEGIYGLWLIEAGDTSMLVRCMEVRERVIVLRFGQLSKGRMGILKQKQDLCPRT